ncbi:MAG: TolC family protein [Gammaproteobacteria bacterium]
MYNLSTFVQSAPAKVILLAAVVCARAAMPAPAADAPQLDATVAALVDQTLAANLEIARSEAEVLGRLAEIDEARARFRPSLDFTSRYTRADGGRAFDFPVGDLLNPVYASLNATAGASFTPIQNQTIKFLRPTEQDTRVTLTQSLYDARNGPALAASRALHRSATASLAALRARLVRDVQQGYYSLVAARDGAAILDHALELARDNLRTNQSLFTNGKVTRDYVLRADADRLALEQQKRAAASAVTLAGSYLNLLRRLPLDTEMPIAIIDAESAVSARAQLADRTGGSTLAHLTDFAIDRRPELSALAAALAASGDQESVARAAFKPRVFLSVDAGSQSEHYRFASDDRFVQASVVVQFKAFSGGADSARVATSRAASDALRAERDQAKLGIQFDVQRALEALDVADASLDTAAQRAAAADAALAIVSRKRDLGQVNQTEFLDARNALTDADLNLSRTRADALARLADLEYAVGAAADIP